MKINQVDNLLEPEILKIVCDRITDPLINWGTFTPDRASDSRQYDWYQMTHLIEDNDLELSPLIDIARIVVAQAMSKSGRQLKRVFRARLINSHPGDLGRTVPHIDLPGPHNTGIFFPTTSSGDTVVYEERSWLETWERPEQPTESARLAPVENTWYDFDGTHWRISGRPDQHDQRICLVVNFVATTPQE